MQVKDFQGHIGGIFAYKILFISIKTNFKVTFDYGAMSLGVDFPLHNQNVKGRFIPHIDVSNFAMNIDSSKLKIELSGSILADIADKFIGIFKSLIIKEIQKTINK